MPWPVDTAKAIAARFAARVETLVLAIDPTIDPLALSRAVRSARGMWATLGRVVAPEVRALHDHIAWWGRQYFVDTAEDEFVARHGSIWGVDPRPATKAVGAVDIEGDPGAVLPSGLELAGAGGVTLTTIEAVTIGQNGVGNGTAIAVEAGPEGNLEAGIRLAPVVPNPAITAVTVADAGMAGGAEAETPESHALATQAHIRQRPMGGAGFDYPAWLSREFAVHAVAVLPDWIGRGSVGVAVAMADGAFGRAPTAAELTAMLGYLGAPGSATGVRPVTAHVVMPETTSLAIDTTVRLRPDNAQTRAAVTEAWTRFLATLGDADDPINDSAIGAKIELSRLSEAVSSASGEYAHDLILPAANIQLGDLEFPAPGTLTFEAAP